MANQEGSEVVSTTSSPAYRTALEDQKPKLNAMPEAEIERKITLDPSAASTVAEASVKKAQMYRAALIAQFGAIAGQLLDELLTVARATRQADIEVSGGTPSNDLSAMNEVVRTDHRLLLTDGEGLVNRNLLDPQQLDAARDVQGYEALIRSVLVLVFVLRERLPHAQGRTALTEADLDRAETNAQRMSVALGDRENGVSRAPALELRARATSKLTRLYEELRRMMAYIRWHQGDADAIVPSLWANRGHKSRSQSGTEPNEPDSPALDPTIDADEPEAPVTPSPMNGGGPFVS